MGAISSAKCRFSNSEDVGERFWVLFSGSWLTVLLYGYGHDRAWYCTAACQGYGVFAKCRSIPKTLTIKYMEFDVLHLAPIDRDGEVSGEK